MVNDGSRYAEARMIGLTASDSAVWAVASGISLKTHHHTLVQPGGGNSGPPA